MGLCHFLMRQAGRVLLLLLHLLLPLLHVPQGKQAEDKHPGRLQAAIKVGVDRQHQRAVGEQLLQLGDADLDDCQDHVAASRRCQRTLISFMQPSKSVSIDSTSAPLAIGCCSWATLILSAGRNTMEGIPAAAQYAESAAEVSPAQQECSLTKFWLWQSRSHQARVC